MVYIAKISNQLCGFIGSDKCKLHPIILYRRRRWFVDSKSGAVPCWYVEARTLSESDDVQRSFGIILVAVSYVEKGSRFNSPVEFNITKMVLRGHVW